MYYMCHGPCSTWVSIHVVHGSDTCVGCYIDITLTPPLQNWLFLCTGSSPFISFKFHTRLHACIPVSFSSLPRHSLVVDHTITLIEMAVLECYSRLKSDKPRFSQTPISLLASQHIHRCRFPASNNQKPCHPVSTHYTYQSSPIAHHACQVASGPRCDLQSILLRLPSAGWERFWRDGPLASFWLWQLSSSEIGHPYQSHFSTFLVMW